MACNCTQAPPPPSQISAWVRVCCLGNRYVDGWSCYRATQDLHLCVQVMKSDETKHTNFKMRICNHYIQRGPTTSWTNIVNTRTEKCSVEECGAVASVVFLEGGSLCFQLGNVQAKLKLCEWSASQRLHCLNSD